MRDFCGTWPRAGSQRETIHTQIICITVVMKVSKYFGMFPPRINLNYHSMIYHDFSEKELSLSNWSRKNAPALSLKSVASGKAGIWAVSGDDKIFVRYG